MSLWVELALALVLGPALWLIGAIFFDFVHFVLHVMLRSRWRLLRALAWPHGIHHAWIDRNLEVQWAYQRRNVWCHIVPEYGTQLLYTAALALVLPLPFALVVLGLQTLVFVMILRARGLDLNHRPIEMLDAYRPGPWTPPAYHALHHVYPDAYFSAYTKTVDFLVRGAAQLDGRRFAFVGAEGAFGRALRGEVARQGGETVEAHCGDAIDVLVLLDPAADPTPHVEAFIDATRSRKLPPEVWAVHASAEAPEARYYHSDVRVSYRTVFVGDAARIDPGRAARRAVSRIRRGFHFVSTAGVVAGVRDGWRFRAVAPAIPPGARAVRHRTAFLAA